MQVFVNISSRGCFYYEELCPSAFIGWLELWWAPFVPCLQLLPGAGSIQILSYTLQRWSLVPIRDQCLAAQPGDLSRPHFLGVGPSQWSEPITVPSRDLAYPPFCGSNFGSLPLPVYTFGSCRPRHTCHWQWVTPTGLVMHCGNTGLGTLHPLLPQSIIDRQNRGIIREIPPIPKLHAGRQLLWNGAFVDMQEGKDTTDSSVPFQILWLTVFYGTRITGDIGY
jgi:hypothetical protein